MDENRDQNAEFGFSLAKTEELNIFEEDFPKAVETNETAEEQTDKPKSFEDERPDGEETSETGEARAMFYENDPARREVAEKLYKDYHEHKVKGILNLSLWGLILSMFFGLGAVLSVISLFRARFELKKAESKTLRWATYISVIGAVLGLAIFFTTTFFVATYVPAASEELPPPPPTETVLSFFL